MSANGVTAVFRGWRHGSESHQRYLFNNDWLYLFLIFYLSLIKSNNQFKRFNLISIYQLTKVPYFFSVTTIPSKLHYYTIVSTFQCYFGKNSYNFLLRKDNRHNRFWTSSFNKTWLLWMISLPNLRFNWCHIVPIVCASWSFHWWKIISWEQNGIVMVTCVAHLSDIALNTIL